MSCLLLLRGHSMLQMGFQYFGSRRWRCGYDKLTSSDQKLARPRRRWVKYMNGSLRGLRLSKSKKLSLRAFSAIVLAGRIAKLYTDIVDRMSMESIYPAIVFPTQWGFPVLSHQSVFCRKSYIYHS
ncbi:hypothetical protein L6164_034892 [Bauhinia variegata]|uniref:Uncharacterized protein n=1 Tax=Bauhinia variegata TaxID=167791 RepID=A0ACB9KW90_BAUVA|nr:hypothetical protein L6164_034892 [Bauhinia variegata]